MKLVSAEHPPSAQTQRTHLRAQRWCNHSDVCDYVCQISTYKYGGLMESRHSPTDVEMHKIKYQIYWRQSRRSVGGRSIEECTQGVSYSVNSAGRITVNHKICRTYGVIVVHNGLFIIKIYAWLANNLSTLTGSTKRCQDIKSTYWMETGRWAFERFRILANYEWFADYDTVD